MKLPLSQNNGNQTSTFLQIEFFFSLADDQDLKDLLIGESNLKNHNEDDESMYLETLGTSY